MLGHLLREDRTYTIKLALSAPFVCEIYCIVSLYDADMPLTYTIAALCLYGFISFSTYFISYFILAFSS